MQALLAVFGGGVVVIGAIVAAAYGLFKIFGEKWLDSRFAERREALKHEQQKELETLRIQFARLTDRATKLNQREFDAIPEAWGRLCEAYSRAASLMWTGQIFPDIDNMPPAQQKQFIIDCKLAEWEKCELEKSKNKKDFYVTRIFWHRLQDTMNHEEALRAYILKNGILMPKEIRLLFQSLDEMIRSALNEQVLIRQSGLSQACCAEHDKFFEDGPGLMGSLERAIEKRLSDLSNLKTSISTVEQ